MSSLREGDSRTTLPPIPQRQFQTLLYFSNLFSCASQHGALWSSVPFTVCLIVYYENWLFLLKVNKEEPISVLKFWILEKKLQNSLLEKWEESCQFLKPLRRAVWHLLGPFFLSSEPCRNEAILMVGLSESQGDLENIFWEVTAAAVWFKEDLFLVQLPGPHHAFCKFWSLVIIRNDTNSS